MNLREHKDLCELQTTVSLGGGLYRESIGFSGGPMKGYTRTLAQGSCATFHL